MDYKLRRLENGLRVLTVPMPSLESATLTVWVKAGSRNEEKKINGISHFLEHMAFKGSKKRPTAKKISEVIDSIGGEFNAATSKDWTNFYVKARASKLEVSCDVLSDMIINPILDSSEIEREKGTIIEELRMYEDTPMIKIGDVFESLIFKGNSLGWEIGGEEKTVRRIERNDFLRYRKSHYNTDNIILTVAGGVTDQKAFELSNKYFSALEKNTSKKSLEIDQFKVIQNKPQIKLYSKKKEQAHFIMGFLGDGRGYKNRFAQGVLSAILGGGMSSRLFIEVRERRGLAYAVRTSIDRYLETGYIGTYVGADIAKADEAVKVVLDEHYKLTKPTNISFEKEVIKAKEYLKGHLALALEDTRDVGSFFGEQELFLKDIKTPEEIFKSIDKVTPEDCIYEAKRLFVPEHLNLAIIGPYKNDEKFAKILK
ncbi:MAG: pitrilysin family protein [Candidatus Woesebacteria bacterium]|nr:pitrilysin family protein [Candidatus Woesebacteria bacterium]